MKISRFKTYQLNMKVNPQLPLFRFGEFWRIVVSLQRRSPRVDTVICLDHNLLQYWFSLHQVPTYNVADSSQVTLVTSEDGKRAFFDTWTFDWSYVEH